MRIIDANQDFYDFYQNIYRDDTFTFDRRQSYNLSKEEFASHFSYCTRPIRRYSWMPEYKKESYILLQVCNTFWLIKLISKKESDCGSYLYGTCLDYDLELLNEWKDYTHKRVLVSLSHITFNYGIKDKFVEAVKNKNYRVEHSFNKFEVAKSKGIGFEADEKTIPILKNIGIPSVVNPLDIYLAFEEYFAQEKTDSERTESVGFTNDEKIESHGFDLKSSFRGK